MKILFIHNRYKQDGGEDVVVELETSILSEKGHEVKTLLFDNRSINSGISKIIAAIRSVYNFSSAKKVSKIINEFKPDIIHVHNLFFISSPSVLYAAGKKKIPVILTLHNYRLICANAILLRNNRPCELCISKKFPISGTRYKCYRNSSIESAAVTAITGLHKLYNTWKNKIYTYITLTEFSKSKFLHSSLQVPEHKMITKPNFVPDPGESNNPREDFFLFAGRIIKEKGVHVLIKAFAEMPESKIIIIGDGPEKESLQKEFQSSQNILFTGYLGKQKVNEYMNRCKALVCPSIWWEGAPLTVIEAFATGTPVIASRLEPMAESVSDGFNGLLFTAGDADDLKRKIKLFNTETNNNSFLYKNARQTYLEKFSPDIHYDAILKIYQLATAGNNA